MKRLVCLFVLISFVALLGISCNGDDSDKAKPDDQTTTTQQTKTDAPPDTEKHPGDSLIDTLKKAHEKMEDAKEALDSAATE